jgi:hypothetical protein
MRQIDRLAAAMGHARIRSTGRRLAMNATFWRTLARIAVPRQGLPRVVGALASRAWPVLLGGALLGSCTSTDGGNGGMGAADGTGGASGSGGGGATPDAPLSDVLGPNGCYAEPDPSPAFPASRDPDLIARAATVVGSCIEDDGITRNIGYMWNSVYNQASFSNLFVLQAECLAYARCGCRAVEACLGFTLKRSDAGSCDACTGSIHTDCGPGYRGTFDCARVGLECDPLKVCSDTPAVRCDPSTFIATCDDATGSPLVCLQKGSVSTVAHLTPCGTAGLACRDGRCQGTGDACSGGMASPEGDLRFDGLGCVGDDLDACVGGRKTRFDCSGLGPGFSCQDVGARYFCGLASECAPAPQGPVLTVTATSRIDDETCDGATVVICNAGRVDRIDCTSLGFTGCEVNKANHTYGCTPGPTLD